MSKKNLLFIVDHYLPNVGGAEIVYHEVARHFAQQGWRVDVITTSDPKRDARATMDGVTIHSTCKNRYLLPILGFVKAWRMSRNADILQTTTYTSGVLGWVVAKLRRKPVCMLVHELLNNLWFKELNWFAASLHYLFEKILIALPFNHYIVPSVFTEKQLLRKGIAHFKITVIPHGVDSTEFDPDNQDPRLRERMGYTDQDFVLLYFGRPGILKGAKDLVEAIKNIEEPHLKLMMILSDQKIRDYQQVEEKIENDKRIHLLKPVNREKVPHYIASADAVIVPSLQEGFGFSAVESCQMGKPVIVSRAGALPESVFGQVIFVEPGSPHSIAQGIKKAMRNEWKTISAKNYSWKKALKAYEQIYQQKQ